VENRTKDVKEDIFIQKGLGADGIQGPTPIKASKHALFHANCSRYGDENY